MMQRKRSAFTLVELLVVIAIISILAALLLPALEDSIAMARLTACGNNQKQLYLSMTLYADSYNGQLARADLGRTNGSWTSFEYSICNDRPVGDPFSVVRHGAWLLGGIASVDIYFCPGVSYEHLGVAWPTMEERRKLWHQSSAQTFFESGGMSGNASRGAMTPTSYGLNPTLWGGGTATIASSHYPLNEMLGCTKIDQLKSHYPILLDTRTIYSGTYRVMHHGGRGFNVLGGDGAVHFLTPPDFVASAGHIFFPARQFYDPWRGVQILPEDPNNAIDQTAWTAWYSYLPNNPFGNCYVPIFQGAMSALVHSGK